MSYATAELLGRVERRPYQHHSAAIPYQNLDPVGAAATEHQHGTAKGVLPQCLFGQCRQRIGAFAEVDRPRYDQHSHAGRNRRLPLERTSRRWRGGMGCGRSRSIPGGGWLATAPWHCRRKGRWGSCRLSPPRGEPAPSAATPSGIVEIEITGTVIRVAPGVDWRHLRDVLRAVKAAR